MDRERTPASLHGSPTGYASRRAEMGPLLDALRRARSTVPAGTSSQRFEGPQRFEGDPVALTLALHPAGLRSARRSRHQTLRAEPRSMMTLRVTVFDGAART
jgi:hypothetical protein